MAFCGIPTGYFGLYGGVNAPYSSNADIIDVEMVSFLPCHFIRPSFMGPCLVEPGMSKSFAEQHK